MSLFVLSCKDGWVNIMYDGLDAVGVDQQVTMRGMGRAIWQELLPNMKPDPFPILCALEPILLWC